MAAAAPDGGVGDRRKEGQGSSLPLPSPAVLLFFIMDPHRLAKERSIAYHGAIDSS
jgi:hypothetical protein